MFLLVYLRTTCTKTGESEQGGVEEVVQLTLKQRLRRYKQRRAWKQRVVGIKKVRFDDGRNVLVIQRWELVHRAVGGGENGRGRREGREPSSPRPIFFSLSYIGGHIAGSGVPAVAGRVPQIDPLAETRK